MTPAQMETFRRRWRAARPRVGRFEGLSLPAGAAAGLSRPRAVRRRKARGVSSAPAIAVPADLAGRPSSRRCRRRPASARCSTRSAAATATSRERIVTTSPDVTVSTNLGPWVNRRGLFAREAMADTFKSERIPSTFNWEFSPKGQHIELGIAEMNLFILLSALGLSHSHQRRAAAADRHAVRSVHRARPRCAQLRLLPGCALHPGGDAVGHHAGRRRRRASVDRHAADRHGAGRARGVRAGLCRRARRHPGAGRSTTSRRTATASRPSATGCATRPAARSICGCRRGRSSRSSATMTPELRQQIVDGAYWLRKPGPNCAGDRRLHRRGRAGGDRGGRPDGRGPPRRRPARRHLGRPAQRRLDRGAARARARPRPCALAYRAAAGGRAAALRHRHACSTAIRRRWPGSARSPAIARAPLGVEHFGQTGSLAELYRHYGIDANAIVAAAQAIAPGRPIRHLKALP